MKDIKDLVPLEPRNFGDNERWTIYHTREQRWFAATGRVLRELTGYLNYNRFNHQPPISGQHPLDQRFTPPAFGHQPGSGFMGVANPQPEFLYDPETPGWFVPPSAETFAFDRFAGKFDDQVNDILAKLTDAMINPDNWIDAEDDQHRAKCVYKLDVQTTIHPVVLDTVCRAMAYLGYAKYTCRDEPVRAGLVTYTFSFQIDTSRAYGWARY